MNKDDLLKLIRTEVREAIREEFRDILCEAVEISSRPENNVRYMPEKSKAVPGRVREVGESRAPISRLLQDTANNMSREDYRNIYESSVAEPSAVNLEETALVGDDELPLFALRAKNVYDASKALDQQRHGI